MIAKSALASFLHQTGGDLTVLKALSDESLDAVLAGMTPRPSFVTRCYKHQKVGFIASAASSSLLFYDPGTGKTKIALDVIRYHIQQVKSTRRALVLVPNLVNVEEWRRQMAQHAPDLSGVYLDDSCGDRRAAMASRSDVVVMTYAGLVRLVSTSVTATKGKKAKKLVLDRDAAEDMLEQFGVVVFDESTALMNWQSLTFKVCSVFLRTAKIRIAMTGTPVGRDMQALWSQFYAVDGGRSLGGSIGLFRDAFFTKKKCFWGGYDYSFMPKRMSLLQQKMANSAVKYSITECLDLPEKVYCVSPVVFSEEQRAYYDAELARIRGADSAEAIQNSFMALCQLAAGFIKTEDGIVDLSPNRKIEALLDLLATIPEDEKVVIYCHFIHSGDLLAKALSPIGKVSRLYSGTKDRGAELRRFVDDPKCRFLVANVQAAAMGLNLQFCKYMVFYESPSSPILREQAERRIWRNGQERATVFFDLVIKGSIEEKLIGYLREGRDLLAALMSREDSV
jgi:SNF2 family DNA or RNA helicase